MPNVNFKWWRWSLSFFAFFSLTSMALMSVGAAVFLLTSVVVIAMGWRSWGRQAMGEALRHPLTLATAALFACSLLSLVAAQIWPPPGGALPGIFELKKFHYFLYPGLIALALLYSADQPERHPFWRAWGAVAALVCVAGFLQFFAADLFPEAWLGSRFFRAAGNSGRYHAQGFMFFHLSFASCVCFVAAAGLARVLFPLRWDSARTRVMWGLLGVAAVAAVYFTFSRIGLVALLAIVATLGFLRRPLVGLAAVVGAIGLFALIWQQSPSLRARFIESSAGIYERRFMWQSAWEMLKDRPLTGVGFGRTGHYSPEYVKLVVGDAKVFTSHAHNNALDQLGATGLLGFLAYLFWWGVLFWEAGACFARGPREERWLAAAALAGLLAFQMNGLTQVNFWDGKSQHTLMLWAGITMAISLRRRRREA